MTMLPPGIITTPPPAITGSPFYGNQSAPGYVTNAFYLPPGYMQTNSTFAADVARVYYVPFAVQSLHTFQGASVFNADTSATGQKCRIMVFASTDGGPGLLQKDFGEITFGATAILNTLASSWTATPGIYWFSQWYNSATPMKGMFPGASNGGTIVVFQGMMLHHMMGNMLTQQLNQSNQQTAYHYVDTAYGAAPATAVAPTTSFSANYANFNAIMPAFCLKA